MQTYKMASAIHRKQFRKLVDWVPLSESDNHFGADTAIWVCPASMLHSSFHQLLHALSKGSEPHVAATHATSPQHQRHQVPDSERHAGHELVNGGRAAERQKAGRLALDGGWRLLDRPPFPGRREVGPWGAWSCMCAQMRERAGRRAMWSHLRQKQLP